MSKQDSKKTNTVKQDPSALSGYGKIIVVGLLLLFAVYMIFLG